MAVISEADESGEPERAAELVIVGAGITGLSVAHLVSNRCGAATRIVVLDKARGVGGRLATRRVGDATFDHGAPEFDVRCEPLRDLVDAAERDGSAARSGDSARGIPAMTAFPKWIARSLTTGRDVERHSEQRTQPSILLSTQVRSIEPFGDRWRLRTDGFSVTASILVLPCPVPQALALLDAGGVTLDRQDRAVLDRISYSPCLVVLAAPAVLRSTSEYASEHWDDSDASIIDAMTAEARDSFGPTSARQVAQVQRWRFARAAERHDQALLTAKGLPPLIFAGDAFGPGDVDGAAASALAAHKEILDLLGNLA